MIFKEKNGEHNFVEVVSLSIQDYVKIKIIENSYPGGSITTVRRDMFHFKPCSKGYYYYGRKK